MKHYAVLYVCTLVVMVALDLTWLGCIAKDFYKSRMGDLLDFQALPGILFYLMYAAGVVFFTQPAASGPWTSTLIYGALTGFFAYATYDLTNMATLRGWSWTLALSDMAWGTFVTGLSATAGRLIAERLS